MNEYIIAYYMGKQPPAQTDQKEGMKKFQEWIESHSEAVVNPGTPLGKSQIIAAQDSVAAEHTSRLTGFSIVQAEDMDAAMKIAKTCPFLEVGIIEVAPIMDWEKKG